MIKKIDGYSKYFVSDDGKVYSSKRRKLTVLSQRLHNGYYYVNLCENGKYKSKQIHKLVCEAFVPNINNYPIVNHIDGNKTNNNKNNLEWCTLSHNVKEAFKLGLIKARKGANSNLFSGKLNKELADKIRFLFINENKANGVNKIYLKLAKQYDVSKATIINIIKNRVYV